MSNPRPGSCHPNSQGTSAKCAVLEIGKNSVSPCTRPSTITSSKGIKVQGSANEEIRECFDVSFRLLAPDDNRRISRLSPRWRLPLLRRKARTRVFFKREFQSAHSRPALQNIFRDIEIGANSIYKL